MIVKKNLIKVFIFLSLLFFFISGSIFGGNSNKIKIRASVDSPYCTIDQLIEYTISISNLKNPSPPDISSIKDFKLNTSSKSSEFSLIKGVSEYKSKFVYLLKPLKKGVLSIPSIKYITNNKTFFLKSFKIKVGNKKKIKKKRQNSFFKDVFKKNKKKKWKTTGTGIIISKKGHIVTNYHLIKDTKKIIIDLYKKNKKYSFNTEIKNFDKKNDLAILKIKDKTFIPFKTILYKINFKTIDVGARIYVLGYPMAYSGMGEELKYSEGSISSHSGYKGDISTYQISAPLHPGNSGAPVFDNNGNLIGIVNAKIKKAFNVGYAIKSNYLKKLILNSSENFIIPNSSDLNTKTIPNQIKELREYVVLVKTI